MRLSATQPPLLSLVSQRTDKTKALGRLANRTGKRARESINRAASKREQETDQLLQPQSQLRVQLFRLGIYKVVVQPSLPAPQPSGQHLFLLRPAPGRRAGKRARAHTHTGAGPKARRKSSPGSRRAHGLARRVMGQCLQGNGRHGAGAAKERPPYRCSGGRGWSREGGAWCRRHRSKGASSARWASTFVASCTGSRVSRRREWQQQHSLGQLRTPG